jgi:hypothetical protein
LNQFISEPVERLAKIAIQILTKAERLPGGGQQIINDWMNSSVIAIQQEKWWGLVKLLTTERFIGQLRRSAKCDILFAYAMSLFDNEQTRIDSIPYLEMVTSESPMDPRTWIPLYSLYEETSSRKKIISHLERVIPMIQQDRSILDNTPLNLESLKNSLRRARNQVQVQVQVQVPAQVQQMQDEKSVVSDEHQIHEDKNLDQQNAPQLTNAWLEALGSVKNAETTDPQIESQSQNTHTGSRHVLSVDDKDNLADNTFEETPNPNTNWRDFGSNLIAPPGTTARIMKMAFASEIEKHMAVQCTAMMTGETGALESWHWPVWRNADAFDYSLSPTGRINEDNAFRHYGTPLHRLLRLLKPLLLRTYQRRFLIQSKMALLGMPSDFMSVEVNTKHPAISRGVLRFFDSFAADLKVRFFDTAGLGAEVFFDFRTQAIHFDAKWQMGLPPGVFSYRALEILIQLQRRNAGLTDLDPRSEILPMIDDLRKLLMATGIAKLRVAFGMDHRELNAFLGQVNRDEIVSLMRQTSGITANDIAQLQNEIRLKSLSMILASSLDLIGILESLSGRDLCGTGALKAGNIVDIHPLARHLLKIAGDLTI